MPELRHSLDAETFDAYDQERLVVSTTVVGPSQAKLVPSVGLPCAYLFVTFEEAGCRYRLDGGDPTATVGHLRYIGDVLEVVGPAGHRLKLIRSTGVDAVAQLTYFRKRR